ncbi:MAG: hypothetical protein NVS2B14_14540 [Chamaesiphon sp.]
MSNSIDQLTDTLNQAIADGLNQAAHTVLADIQQHVQVRTGALRDSYALVQMATPDNLQVVVDSPLNYKQFNYPPVQDRIRPEINRGLQGDPPLFPDDGSTDKLEAMVASRTAEGIAAQAIEDNINRAFS